MPYLLGGVQTTILLDARDLGRDGEHDQARRVGALPPGK